MTREQIDAIERLEAKATAGPGDVEYPIDDENPWIVEAGKPTHDWRCLAMVTKADDDINVTEGSANADLLIALRNNAKALCAAARSALETLRNPKKAAQPEQSTTRLPHGSDIDACK